MNTFEKIFSRDFCMIALEVAALSELRDDKPWLDQPQPHRPYLLIERSDGTAHMWYNQKGLAWINEALIALIESDSGFLQAVEDNVRKGIAHIQPIYDGQQVVDREALIDFIDGFLAAYPWIEAMWWIKDMDPNKVGDGHAQIVKLRAETEGLSANTEIVIRKSLEALYPELGILSARIRLEEFRSDNIPPATDLRERLEGFTLTDGKFMPQPLFEIALEKDLILIEEAIDPKATVITGQTGYAGKVTGTVCRVMGHLDFGKIQVGQILVSPMTMVDFLPEMKKAAAFITDEGGVTCHAAIIAREMAKPCVVGTKNASRILKDGDMVEVDATQGLIRIINE